TRERCRDQERLREVAAGSATERRNCRPILSNGNPRACAESAVPGRPVLSACRGSRDRAVRRPGYCSIEKTTTGKPKPHRSNGRLCRERHCQDRDRCGQETRG